jgi:hypothetical protein
MAPAPTLFDPAKWFLTQELRRATIFQPFGIPPAVLVLPIYRINNESEVRVLVSNATGNVVQVVEPGMSIDVCASEVVITLGRTRLQPGVRVSGTYQLLCCPPATHAAASSVSATAKRRRPSRKSV